MPSTTFGKLIHLLFAAINDPATRADLKAFISDLRALADSADTGAAPKPPG